MMQFQATDCLGYAASAAVLTTFAVREMRVLRLVAIGSNVLFIWYAHRSGLGPVLLLHSLLLPLNTLRLYQAIRAGACERAARQRSSRCTRPRRAAALCTGGTRSDGVNAHVPPHAPVAWSGAEGSASPTAVSCRSWRRFAEDGCELSAR